MELARITGAFMRGETVVAVSFSFAVKIQNGTGGAADVVRGLS